MTKAVQTRLTHYFSNKTTGQINPPWQTNPPPSALKLPNELWVHIFSYVCANECFIPGETRHDNDVLYNTTTTPFRSIRHILKLSLICRHLRDIIRSTPSLWSTISLNIRRANATPILQLSLQRASEHLLNIEITDTRSALHEEDTQAQLNNEAVRLLLGATQRWRSLRLFLGTSWDTFKEPEGALTPGFPLLESLRVDYVVDLERYSNNQTPHWLRDSLQSAPRLTTLITRNAAVLDILPCHQLTSLEIQYLSGTPERVAQILQTCPNLTTLSLDSWLAIQATDDQVLPSRHGKLRRLVISVRGLIQDSIATLFNSLTFPSLTSLQVTYEPRELRNFWSLHTLIGMIRRSSCSLETLSLHINVMCMLDTFTSDLFTEIPTITDLEVTFISEDRDDDLERAVVGFLWKLAVRPSKRASRVMTVFLPKLLGIKLRHSSSSEGVMNAAQGGLKHLASSRSRANLEALGGLRDILPLVSTQLVSERVTRLRLPNRDYIDLTMLSDSETDDE